MPESHLGWRGDFIPRRNETSADIKARKAVWEENQLYLREWNRLFDLLGDSRDSFISAIGDNNITIDKFISLTDSIHKKLFIHYFTMTTMLKAFSIESLQDRKLYISYITEEFPIMYQRLIKYVANSKMPYSSLQGLYVVMGKKAISDILRCLDYEAQELPFVVHNLSKIQEMTKKSFFDFELIKCLFMYSRYGILNRKDKNTIINAIKSLDERTTREFLLKHFKSFKETVINNTVSGEAGAEYIINELDKQLTNVYEQLSLFDI